MPKHHFPSPADDGGNIVFEVNGCKLIGQGWLVDTLFDKYKVVPGSPGNYVKGLALHIPHASQSYDFFVVDKNQLLDILQLEEFKDCGMLASEAFLSPIFSKMLSDRYRHG